MGPAAAIAGIATGAGTALSGYLGGRAQKHGQQIAAGATRYGVDVNKELQEQMAALDVTQGREQQALQEELLQRQRQAESQAAGGVFGELRGAQQPREQRLNELFGGAPPELQQLKEDILSGQAEQLQRGTGQLQSGLAQAGVRGGQQATQLRRGIGEMTQDATRDINQILASEAMQRAGSERAYQGGLSQLLTERAYDPNLLAQKTGAFADIDPVLSYEKERESSQNVLDRIYPKEGRTGGAGIGDVIGDIPGSLTGITKEQYMNLFKDKFKRHPTAR